MAKQPPKKKKATIGATKPAKKKKKGSKPTETAMTRSDPEFLAEPEQYPELAPTGPEVRGPGEDTMETARADEVLADSYIGKPYPKPQNIPGPRHPDAPHIEDCRGEYETETHYIYLIKPECYERMGLKKVIIPKS